MSLPVKKSIAVLIRNGPRMLATRRSDRDDELPGVWGLPAGSFRGSETHVELIARIGQEKLGVHLRPLRLLTRGSQARPAYVLEMELWEAKMEGEPRHPEWRWASPDIFGPGVQEGSLCCALALSLPASDD